MALTTQTWRLSAEYGVTIAGANATVAELLTAINAAFVAENTIGSNLWMVSAYSAANGTLEIKRKGTPGGTLQACRILFHGRTSVVPHANAIALGLSAATNNLYMGIAPEASTTGPPTLPTAGVPYAAGAYWSRSNIVANTNDIVNANNPKIRIIECDRVCCVVIRETGGGMSVACAGECIEDLSTNTGVWAAFCSQGKAIASAVFDASVTNNPVPTCGYYSTQQAGTFSTAGAISAFGRVNSVPQVASQLTPFAGGTCAVTIPIYVGQRGEGDAVPTLLGCLRQIRMGPYNTGVVQIFNTAAVLQGYQVNGGGGVGAGLIFDLSP